MPEVAAHPSSDVFFDRRSYETDVAVPVRERRQFSSRHDGLSPEARDLALAIDGYKLRHRRRFITFEEMLSVIKSLGYRQQADSQALLAGMGAAYADHSESPQGV